jgi:thiamine-phosphate pyrophosphorylase
MHQTTPGVERAVLAARGWADRLGSEPIRLTHLVLALLDEEEGRPAILLESVGVSVPEVRSRLARLESSAAPQLAALYSAARAWSIAHRHDPEFLTDAFLIAIIAADERFAADCAALGFSRDRLERSIVPAAVTPDGGLPFAAFELPDSTLAEIDTARILDANLNRAREAARVVEDYCRFVLEDRFLTETAKELKHGVANASRSVPQHVLHRARETLRDVGSTVTAGSEYDRASPTHVAIVNLKRLQESLRSLEEFGKVFSSNLGQEVEALRYRTYTLERAISLRATSRDRLAAVRLYVLVSRAQCPAALDWTIQAAARGGADAFQLREKTLADRELLDVARAFRLWTRDAGTLFIVNDRPDIARLCEADGVHLGQEDMSVKDARRIAGPELLIGVSTHTLEQLHAAILDGADYVGIGPTFPSTTKSFHHFPGLELVRAVSQESTLPAFALGGISPANIAEVVAAGARRVAVSAAVCAAEDPEHAARLLKAALPHSATER